ncbi:MAG: NAD(P)/FAD-dependent oxidoreductase [Alkalispirochaeta sp.]
MSTRTWLLLLGAGHAHLPLIHAIPRLRRHGVSVTVVDPNDRLWYTGMMSAVLGGAVAPFAAEIPVRSMVESGAGIFLLDSVTRIDPDRRLVFTASGAEPAWDVASVAVGSTVVPPFPVADGDTPRLFPVKPIGRLPEIVEFAQGALDRSGFGRTFRVVCVGGGPSAVEIAGNLIRRLRISRGVVPGDGALSVTVVTRGSRLLTAFPAVAGDIVRESLVRRRVKVVADEEEREVSAEGVVTDRMVYPADAVIVATGLNPPTLNQSLTQNGDSRPTADLWRDDDGSLQVDDTLRTSQGTLFGGGDCISIRGFDLPRNGVHAVRESRILVHNVQHLLGAGSDTATPHLLRYSPPRAPLLIINPGDGTGIAVKGSIVRHGRSWLALKRRIDWAFVRSRGRSIVPSVVGPPRP